MDNKIENNFNKETYGEKLRNLISPYKLLVDFITCYKNGKVNEDLFEHFIDTFDIENYSRNVDRLINFSKLDVLENNYIEDPETI